MRNGMATGLAIVLWLGWQGVALAESPTVAPLWGNDWMAGGYHQHDLQLNERVGVSLDWQDSRIAGMSFSYSSRFAAPVAIFGHAADDPLTFRLTLRGWELFESNSEKGSDFFSFDRIRDRDIRRQLVMISISKRF